MVNEVMLQQDGQVLFSRSTLSNAGKKVAVLRNVKNLWISSIDPSDPTALTSRVNVLIPNENCGRKCTGLVTV
jgi:hypothetical protein